MTYDNWKSTEPDPSLYGPGRADREDEEDLTVCPYCGYFVRPDEAGHDGPDCSPATPPARLTLVWETCPDCHGTGTTGDSITMCPSCPGTGTVLTTKKES